MFHRVSAENGGPYSHKLCNRSKTKNCVWAMHRLVQLSVLDWLAEGQENRRVVTTRVRVCGVELSPMQRSYGHELRGSVTSQISDVLRIGSG